MNYQKKVLKIFNILYNYGYSVQIPYNTRTHMCHIKDNWEVIYSKLRISISFYFPLSSHEGLKCFSYILEDDIINIYATTWNPICFKDIDIFNGLLSRFILSS